jgi:hypothetical protein
MKPYNNVFSLVHVLMLSALDASVASVYATRKNVWVYRREVSRSTAAILQGIPRGGSSPDPFVLDTEIMSLALRWTAEINRRLQEATAMPRLCAADSPEPLRGGATGPYCIRSAAPEHRQNQQQSELTIFHARSPRSKGGHGIAHWGPALDSYLRHLQATIPLTSLERSLAMIYLDRACSVETPRSNRDRPLPFVTPRTTHRLVLTAWLLARMATDPETSSLQQLYYKHKLALLGVPLKQLKHMIRTMRRALGDVGLIVSDYDMEDWTKTWQRQFVGDSESLEAPTKSPDKTRACQPTTSTEHELTSYSSTDSQPY